MPLRNKLLTFEGSRWVGIHEHGENAGEIVSIFQDLIGPKGQHVAWCCSFSQYCVSMVDAACRYLDFIGNDADLPQTESVVALWNKVKSSKKIDRPIEGCLVIWQHISDPAHGHMGIVEKPIFNGTNMSLQTIEGNTSENGVQGVFRKQRLYQWGDFKLLGFIDPWS